MPGPGGRRFERGEPHRLRRDAAVALRPRRSWMGIVRGRSRVGSSLPVVAMLRRAAADAGP